MSTVRTVKAATPKAPRRRLAPEDRVEQILDCAGQLIMDGGLTEISMERLGRDAGGRVKDASARSHGRGT